MEGGCVDTGPEPAQRWAMMLTAILASIIMILGFLGNLLTILALPHSRRHRKTTTWFVVNLAVTEAIFCVTVLPVTVGHLLHLFSTGCPLLTPNACAYFAFFRYVTMLAGLLSIAAIAINRCVLITMPKIYPKIFNWVNTCLIITSIWILSILVLMPPLLNIYGKFGYNYSTDECDYVDDGDPGPRYLMLFTGYLIPCAIIVASYALIFYKARKSSERMKACMQQNPDNTSNKQCARPAVGLRSRDIRIARTIGVIFAAYIVCCTPVAVMHYVESKDKHMPTLLLLLHPLYWLQYCINMFIYVFMNSQYRQAYVHFLAKCWPGIRTVSSKIFSDPSSDSIRNNRATTPSSLLRFSTRRNARPSKSPTQRNATPEFLDTETPMNSSAPSV